MSRIPTMELPASGTALAEDANWITHAPRLAPRLSPEERRAILSIPRGTSYLPPRPQGIRFR